MVLIVEARCRFPAYAFSGTIVKSLYFLKIPRNRNSSFVVLASLAALPTIQAPLTTDSSQQSQTLHAILFSSQPYRLPSLPVEKLLRSSRGPANKYERIHFVHDLPRLRRSLPELAIDEAHRPVLWTRPSIGK